MPLRAIEILRATMPRGLDTLLPTDIDPLAKRLARKQRLRLGTVYVLAASDSQVTPQEVLGIMYFAQLVKTADDALDRNPRGFNDYGELRSYLLHTEVQGTNGVQIEEILKRSLACFSQDKQAAISLFLNEMVSVHLGSPQRGIPGTYTFEDARDYRRITVDPFLETLAELTNSSKARFLSIGRGGQLVEDGLDWAEDAGEQSKNQFLGMAADTGELSYLQSILPGWGRGRIFDFRIKELIAIKMPYVKNTRERYRQEILDQVPGMEGINARLMATAARILF